MPVVSLHAKDDIAAFAQQNPFLYIYELSQFHDEAATVRVFHGAQHRESTRSMVMESKEWEQE